MSYFKSFVKLPLPILFWFLVFIGFHIHFNKISGTWQDIQSNAWPFVSFMNTLAIAWLVWFGAFKKNVSLISILISVVVSFLFSYYLPVVDWYKYTGFNEHFWRVAFIVIFLIYGIVLWIKNRLPVLNKMILIGAIGILFLQCLHAWVFWMSYQSRQELIINEYHWILTNPSQSERLEECKKREYDCYLFSPSADVSVVKFGVTDFNKGTVVFAQDFVDKALLNKKPGFQYWSWIDEWWRIPNRDWPAILAVQTNENGEHLLLVDGRGMLPIVSSHANFFALLAGLGTLVWCIGSLMVVFFHVYAWRKKAKRKLVEAHAKNN